jgi:endonuclease/exonuclease/phosphatase family metal-dependent hydrolase
MLRRALLVTALAAAACGRAPGGDSPDAAPPDGYPPPRGGLVPAVGGPDTLDLACWNIENFPMTVHTAADVADLVTSLDLDVVVVEEVADTTAWQELLDRLPEHDGILSTHQYTPTSYQKIGVIYRTATVTLSGTELLFTNDTSAFPRPPLHTHLHYDDGTHAPVDLDLVGLHLKAGVTTDDIARRKDAVVALDGWMRGRTDTGYALLGDWNQELDTHDGPSVWAPITGDPALYTIRTAGASAAGEVTYLPFHTMIDHVVTTAAAAPIVGTADAIPLRLDQEYDPYPDVSDHVPVSLTIPLAPR